MAFSKITLTFSRIVEIDEVINFSITDSGVLSTANMICKDPRAGVGQFNYAGDISISIFSYSSYWRQDYSPLDEYDVLLSNVDGEIIISATKNNVTFSGFSSDAGVTAVIVDGDNSAIPEIVSLTYSKKTGDECNTSVATLVCSEVIDNITLPYSISGNGTDTVSFDVPRGQSFGLLFSSLGQTISTVSPQSSTLLTPTPSATIVIVGIQKNLVIAVSGYGLTFTYSLDGITYQASNIFEDVPNGETSFYIKDQFDCVKSSSILIGDPPAPEPYHFISNLNSIRYKLSQVWDNISIYKNDKNTLSCEEETNLKGRYTQRFQKNDTPITQLKTNYSNIKAFIVEDSGFEYPLTVYKKTNYIGKQDSRDAIKIQTESGLWGFYFLSGMIYNYDSGDALETYDLSGELPEWAKVGAYFLLDGVNHQISKIFVEDSVNSFVIAVDSNLSGNDDIEILKATYDLFNYDAYNFEVSMLPMLNKEFHVRIDLTDDRYDDVSYLSERLSSSELLDDLIHFKFWNRDNNDIIYKIDSDLVIYHELRLDYDFFGNSSESETNVLIGDSDAYNNSSRFDKKKEVNFTYLSTVMVEKVQQALSSSHLFIRGNSYIAETIEKPYRIGISNLYNLKATLVNSSKKDVTLDCGGDDYISDCYIKDYYE